MSFFDALRSFLGLPNPKITSILQELGPPNRDYDPESDEGEMFDEKEHFKDLYSGPFQSVPFCNDSLSNGCIPHGHILEHDSIIPEGMSVDNMSYGQGTGNHLKDFSFLLSNGDVFEINRILKSRIDEMMNEFASFWSYNDFQNNSGMLMPAEEAVPAEANPRNKFLKSAYIQPPQPGSKPDPSQIDVEVQDRVSPARILDLFPDKGEVSGPQQRGMDQAQPFFSRASFSSQVLKKKILPNGGVEEERRSVQDGKEEVRVSRELDGMKHVLTTSRLPNGTTETHEEFINMTEYQLADFNKTWSNNVVPSGPSSRDPKSLPPIPSRNDVSLLDILRQFI